MTPAIPRNFRLAVALVLLGSAITAQAPDSTQVKAKDPRQAAYWSLIYPGTGQVYNGKWLKALLLGTLEGIAIYQWNENRKFYRHYSTDFPLPRHRYLEKRNKYAWWMGFLYVYGLLDAVVDAHLSTYAAVMDRPIEEKNVTDNQDSE